MSNFEDEKYGASLLQDYLDQQAHCHASCIVNCNDPPDLIVHFADGQRIGVEVTRACQRVVRDDAKRISSVSRAENTAPLWRFAEDLGKETRIIRHHQDYVLYLEGPPPKVAWETWRETTRKCVLKSVESKQAGVCKFAGGQIRTKQSEACWRVMIGPRPDSHTICGHGSDIDQNIRVMLMHSLEQKSANLSRWNGDYGKSWLLLLNTYPLADDVEKIRLIFRSIASENLSKCPFDGVFWVTLEGIVHRIS